MKIATDAARLEGALRESAQEQRAVAAVIAADHRTDIFLATLAHELPNPLAPIRNAAQILAVPGIGSEQVAWAQKVIARQSALMASLLDDLLDIARLTQGRMELNRQPVEIRGVIDAALKIVRS